MNSKATILFYKQKQKLTKVYILEPHFDWTAVLIRVL